MEKTTDNPRVSNTTISLPEELADELYERKERGESYADVVRRLLEAADGGDTDTDETAEAAPEPTTSDADPATFEAAVSAAAVDIPGRGQKHDARVAAFRAVVAYLRDHGTATPSELKERVYPDHDGRYKTAESWWKNAMYPALASVAETTDAVKSADESGRWQFNGAADD
jgi:Arc/MetJ-type ribon-helix-helix transcriptional regulator